MIAALQAHVTTLPTFPGQCYDYVMDDTQGQAVIKIGDNVCFLSEEEQEDGFLSSASVEGAVLKPEQDIGADTMDIIHNFCRLCL